MTKQFMISCDKEPITGKDVIIFLNDGSETKGFVSKVYEKDNLWIMWYDTKTGKNIPQENLKGWIYPPKVNNELFKNKVWKTVQDPTPNHPNPWKK